MDNNLDQDHVANDAAFGQFGFRKLSGNVNSYKGEKFMSIQVLTDATFTADCGGHGDNDFDDTLTAGTVIYGDFTNINLASGKILAYLIK